MNPDFTGKRQPAELFGQAARSADPREELMIDSYLELSAAVRTWRGGTPKCALSTLYQSLVGFGFSGTALRLSLPATCSRRPTTQSGRRFPFCDPFGGGSAALWISVVVFCLAVPGYAREKTDVVILKNGDHISGEIRGLSRGMLTLKTDSLGTVSIKWPDVVKITSKFEFKVEDTFGQRYMGTIAPKEGTDRLEVAGAGFKSEVALPEIVVMTQADESLWRRFDGSFDAGYSFTKSSVRSQFNLDSDLRYHGSQWEAEATYSSILGSSEGTVDTNRNVVTLKGDRFLGKKWHAIGVGQYEQNAELALDRRVSGGGAVAWRFIQNNRALANISGGLTFTREKYASEPEGSNLEGMLGSGFQIFKLYSPKLDVTLNYSFLPNLTTWGRIRSEFSTKANIEIIRNFFFSLSVYDSFDNQPPAERATKNDYGFVTSVGWTFRR